MSAGRPRIELVCVGTELLSGKINTHQSYLALKLGSIGLSLRKESSLPDDPELLAREIGRALEDSDAVIVCGGLGPTFDDLTREAAAKALGRRLSFKPKLFAAIARKFARHRMPIPEENKRQAEVIAGAEVLENRHGSAPGQLIRLERGRLLVLLPGPYSELAPMFEASVLPRFKRAYARGRHCAALSLHMTGVPESVADEAMAPAREKAGPGVDFTILSGAGQVDFHARALAASAARARAEIDRVRAHAYRVLGRHIFGENGESMAEAVGRALLKRRETLAVAESCTGGLVGARLTAVPGSSRYFLGGVVAYANGVKSGALAVPAGILARNGAVSAQSARAMAEGARRLCGASVGLSVTGIAGPGGGTKAKPVGLAFFSISGPGASHGTWRFRLAGDRDTIRQRAASTALGLLLRRLNRR